MARTAVDQLPQTVHLYNRILSALWPVKAPQDYHNMNLADWVQVTLPELARNGPPELRALVQEVSLAEDIIAQTQALIRLGTWLYHINAKLCAHWVTYILIAMTALPTYAYAILVVWFPRFGIGRAGHRQ